jgi:uncharacterized damage-inducible protein DinB
MTNPEVWLRGPVPDISDLLQPVAHTLLQAREEVSQLMEGFPEDRLWERPWNVASPGFHLQHLSGVLDRLFTYARGEALSKEQLRNLASEGAERSESSEASAAKDLVSQFAAQVDNAIRQLGATPDRSLIEPREVGRARLPSTVLGLLVHAAEHTQRHVGQLLVTSRILRSQS